MRKFLIGSILCIISVLFTTSYAAAPLKEWTFIVFINGNNNLDRFATKNLIDMERVGSDNQVNVVAQWASLSKRKAVRLLVKKSNDHSHVTSPILEDLGLVDMGDYHTLQEFITWAVKNYPAKHYFINVWDHGGGWHLSKKIDNTLPNDISYDELSDNVITTEQLGQVMNYASYIIGHKVDLYGSDACLMAMAEVANEMSDSVKIFAGSQETEPGNGWPYMELLAGWEAIPNAQADQVAKVLAKVYVESYQGGSSGTNEVTFSAFDLSKLHGFNKSLAKLSDSIRQLNPAERSKMINAASDAQRFAFNDYVDTIDLVKKLKQTDIFGLNVDDLNRVQNTASQLVIANERTKAYADANGLSIWMPTNIDEFNHYADRYKKLRFNAESHWGESLGTLLQGAHK